MPTETKEKPISFTGSMIDAILGDMKTQTRRIIKPQPTMIESSRRWQWPIPKSKQHSGCCSSVVRASREWWEYLEHDQMPYQSGMRLWIKTSRFMPKIKAPAWLEIVNVDAERVQDISEEDILSEGIKIFKRGKLFYPPGNKDLGVEFSLTAFRCLWDSIHGPGAWEHNDWVWKIVFKRIEN